MEVSSVTAPAASTGGEVHKTFTVLELPSQDCPSVAHPALNRLYAAIELAEAPERCQIQPLSSQSNPAPNAHVGPANDSGGALSPDPSSTPASQTSPVTFSSPSIDPLAKALGGSPRSSESSMFLPNPTVISAVLPSSPTARPEAMSTTDALTWLLKASRDAVVPPAAASEHENEIILRPKTKGVFYKKKIHKNKTTRRAEARDARLRRQAKAKQNENTPVSILKKLWLKACAPDSNLGVAVIGPSPQKLTMGSAQRVLHEMGVDKDSEFLDIGSGHGLVMLTALLWCNARRSTGVEYESNKAIWSMEALASLPPDPTNARGVGRFENLDITTWRDLAGHTHIYAFDFDFPPCVMREMGRSLRRTQQWVCFASCTNAQEWRKLWLEDENQSDNIAEWWEANAVQYNKVTVRLCGSGCSHTLFLFKKQISPPTAASFPTEEAGN